MADVLIEAERAIAAPGEVVYGILADYREHHPKILPPAFSDYRVEAGGHGAGTVVSFTLTLAGRSQPGRMRVSEPEPGRVLAEQSADPDLLTTFTVTPRPGGCVVRIRTRWSGAGLLARLLVPRMLKPLYEDELNRLDAYARRLAEGKTAEAA